MENQHFSWNNSPKWPFFIAILQITRGLFPPSNPMEPAFSHGFPYGFPIQPAFSHGFPMVFPFNPWFSHGFPLSSKPSTRGSTMDPEAKMYRPKDCVLGYMESAEHCVPWRERDFWATKSYGHIEKKTVDVWIILYIYILCIYIYIYYVYIYI